MIKRSFLATAILALPLAVTSVAQAQLPVRPAAAQTATAKPNIVVTMADDVGFWNVSAYHRGMMGGSTPNIDRIAKEGALFTDYCAQQSCTARRAAFILGQTPFRTGLVTVGLPAAKEGIQTITELLKPYDYATAQIGKNHLGDRNEYLPTVHGSDEFHGILYHLNAMEKPYEPDYAKAPNFRANFGPRNIVDTKATTVDDQTIDPRWGKVGKQVIVDGGRCHHTRTWTPTPRPTWRSSTTDWFAGPSTSWNVPSRPTSHSSFGTIPLARTGGRISPPNGRLRAVTGSMPTP
jgi:arylsulfatase A-like enzyme